MTDKKKTAADLRRRTISQELHEQWRKLERRGDATTLAKILDVSKPTIDKALIYGNVHKQEIIDGINKFFADRLMAEKETAKELADLSRKTKTA